jgi:hypothetical protein
LGASRGFRPLSGRITAFCSHLNKRLACLLKDWIDLQNPSRAGQDYIAIDWIELDPVADPTGFRGRDKGRPGAGKTIEYCALWL